MNNTDLMQAEDMLSAVATNGRISVSGRRSSFTLHNAQISPEINSDFDILGSRRRHDSFGGRTWAPCRLAVAKLLKIEKYRLVVQDIYGNVLTLGPPKPGGLSEEQEQGAV